MKLIIDIEKGYYETLKYNVANGTKYKPWKIIANGKPYEERQNGGWLSADDDHIKCSVCGEYGIHNDWYDCNYYTPFCPNCGADMRNSMSALQKFDKEQGEEE